MKLERSFKLRTIARLPHVRLAPIAILLLLPLAAHAQGTPFDTGFQALQNLFTGRYLKLQALLRSLSADISSRTENRVQKGLWQASLPVLESRSSRRTF